MDVLVLIDKLDELVHNAKAVPLTDQVRIDRNLVRARDGDIVKRLEVFRGRAMHPLHARRMGPGRCVLLVPDDGHRRA